MRRYILLLVLLLAASSVPAQFPEECTTAHFGDNESRTRCKGGGSYGVRRNDDGTVDELRERRNILGRKHWRATPAPDFVAEAEPIVAPDEEALVAPRALRVARLLQSTPPVVDVMVVWTQRAQDRQGGVSAMQALVANAVSRANLAYVNGLANIRIRLVYAARIAYIEGSITTDLSRLFLTTDGHMDTVHALRTQYGADIVTLFGDGYVSQGVAGVGYYNTSLNAIYAFSVVDRTQASTYLSYAHELGHNMRLQHNWANAPCTTNCTGYNFGWRVANQFRTVMSYGGEPRIPYFSNPSVLYNGVATGVSGANNSRALTENAAQIAAFKVATNLPPPAPAPACTFTVSPLTLSPSAAGGTYTITVTTTAGCGWSSASYVPWATVTGVGNASGTAKIIVSANATGLSRSGEVRVSSKRVVVTQAP